MTYSRGDVVKGVFPSIRAAHGGKTRWALVLSGDDYNDSHDHGVFASLSTGVLSETLAGTYQIKDWRGAGCTKPCVVTPWLYTLEWAAVEKTGVLSPRVFVRLCRYEEAQARGHKRFLYPLTFE